MYANLDVTTADGKHYAAWDVEITEDSIIVKLDANDGESSYCVEAGEVVFPIGTRLGIGADF